MSGESITRKEVDAFILSEIESVPHIEALLILRSRPSQALSPAEVAAQLYIPVESAQNILSDLKRRELIRDVDESERYQYAPPPKLELLIQQVEITYRRELVRVANMIHSKASSAMRDFARAFRFTKENE